MFRKLLLLLLEKTCADFPVLQLCLGAMILMLSGVAQLRCQPFRRDSVMNECEAMEIFSSLAIVLMIGLGDVAKASGAAREVIGWLCLVILLLALGRVTQQFRRATRRQQSGSRASEIGLRNFSNSLARGGNTTATI